jgi:hypothetical protein
MKNARIALVAAPYQEDLVTAIAARLSVTGLFSPVRSLWETTAFRVCTSPDELLREADICCFLTPYASLGRDLERTVESGIHALCPGPPPLSMQAGKRLDQAAVRSGVKLGWGGQFLHTLLHQTLVDQVHQASFGSPVFLRLVRGGGNSLLAAGWGAYQGLEQAVSLLQDDIAELNVAGIRRHRRYHFALTAVTLSGATAQLVVAPHHPSPFPDITLLGTGGLLSSTEYSPHPARYAPGRISPMRYPQAFAEPDWIVDFIGRLSRVKADQEAQKLAFFQALRRALTQALSEGKPIRVPNPGSVIPLSSSR